MLTLNKNLQFHLCDFKNQLKVAPLWTYLGFKVVQQNTKFSRFNICQDTAGMKIKNYLHNLIS